MNTVISKLLNNIFHNKKPSFIYRFALLFLCNNIILLCLASFFFFQNAITIILESSYQYTYTIMEQAKDNFDAYIGTHTALLDSIAEDDHLISAYQCNERGEIRNTYRYKSAIVEAIQNIQDAYPEVMDILIVTDNALVINREDGWGLQSDYHFPTTAWYQETLKRKKTSKAYVSYVTTDFYQSFSAMQHQQVIMISRPVYNYLQQEIGAVFYMLFLDDLWSSVLNGYHSQYGDLTITNQNQEIIAHSKRGLEGQVYSDVKEAILADSALDSKHLDPSSPIHLLIPSEKSDCNIVCSLNINIEKETSLLLHAILVILILFLFFNLCIAYYLSRTFNRPVHNLVTDLTNIITKEEKVLNGNYLYSELIFIADHFNELLKNLADLNAQQMQMQVALQKAKNDALLSKINPHFLFNSLQLIQTENLYGSKERTNQIILSLSKQLRYNVYDDVGNIVPLSQELDLTREYLQLCSYIYEDELHFDIAVPKSFYDFGVPKFALHVLVENSIKHGFKGTPYKGHISIIGTQCKEGMELSVTDNGQGFTEENLQNLQNAIQNNTHSGIGLQSLIHQLNFIFGDNYKFHIDRSDGYTIVSMKLPCQKLQR